MNTDVNELYHFGVKGQKHGVRKVPWYPIADYLASKKRKAKVSKDVPKKKLTERIGEKRLNNRLSYTAKNADKFNAQVGLSNNLKGLSLNQLNEQTKEILKDPKRVSKIGAGTLQRRVASISAATIASGAAFCMGAAGAVPIVSIPAGVAILGAEAIYYKGTTR